VAYERRIDRANPGCLMFLVDQSGSMSNGNVYGTTTPKMVAVADQVNNFLTELILACSAGDEGLRYYFDIGVIGYGGDHAGPALAGPLAKNLVSIVELANNPISETPPLAWLHPVGSGATPMCAAMDLAGRCLAEWANNHPDSFPPMVANLSDGGATDCQRSDAIALADRLRSLKTLDGNLLFSNVNISTFAGSPLLFPSSEAELPPNDEYASLLFEMSSRLTPDQMKEASSLGAREGARSFVFNSGIATLRQFLRIGTMTSGLDDRLTG